MPRRRLGLRGPVPCSNTPPGRRKLTSCPGHSCLAWQTNDNRRMTASPLNTRLATPLALAASPHGRRAGQRHGAGRQRRRRPGRAALRHAGARHAARANWPPWPPAACPTTSTGFCHTPPVPDAAREAAWRAALQTLFRGAQPGQRRHPRRPRTHAVQRRGGRADGRVPPASGQLPLRPARARAAGTRQVLGCFRPVVGHHRARSAMAYRSMVPTPSSPRGWRPAAIAAIS
jgi:hypothetical protein